MLATCSFTSGAQSAAWYSLSPSSSPLAQRDAIVIATVVNTTDMPKETGKVTEKTEFLSTKICENGYFTDSRRPQEAWPSG